MKAISLWQPWASLWLTDRKIHETRHWYTPHRGWLAVQATKHFEKDFDQGDPFREILDDEFGGHWAMDLPRGAIIGAVDLVDCISTDLARGRPEHADDRECGNWEPKRFAWRRAAIVKLDRPIPYRGHQTLFTLPDEIVRLILPSQVGAA
jgi:activating signal cointegrator 1